MPVQASANALRPFSESFHGKLMSRSRLRDIIGPDNPMFQLLESLCIVDEYVFEDEFLRTLDTSPWTASSAGAGSPVAFVHQTTLRGGQVLGDAGTGNDGDAALISVGENWSIDNRPVMLARLEPNDNITNSKFEIGFIDADANLGAVLLKATPTSTAADYCVIIRDTDDDTSIDMVVDGTTPTISSTNKVAGTHGVTYTLNSMHNFMIAMNELDEQYFWVNGSLGGSLRSSAAGAGVGPDNDVTLAAWCTVVNRTGSRHSVRLDYIKVLAERTLL